MLIILITSHHSFTQPGSIAKLSSLRPPPPLLTNLSEIRTPVYVQSQHQHCYSPGSFMLYKAYVSTARQADSLTGRKNINFSSASIISITLKIQRVNTLYFQHYLLHSQRTQGQQTRQSPYVISRPTNLILPLDQYSGAPASSRGNPIRG